MNKSAGWFGIWSVVFITVNLYFFSKSDVSVLMTRPFLSLGQVTGLVGIILLSLSFILALRSAFIDKLFGGLDKSYTAHHMTGGIGTMLTVLHPMFFVLQSLPNTQSALRFIVPDIRNPAYLTGMIALSILIVLIVLTLYVRLPYHIWRSLHQWMGAVMISSGIHAALISSDVSRYLPLRIWVLGFSGAALLAALYMRFIYPILKFRHVYEVLSIERTGDMFDIRLKPKGRTMKFFPGQFAFLSVPGVFESGNGHPFSIVSHPSEGILRFGIKISGDHTLRLREVKKGDTVYVQGPYGRLAEPYFIQKSRPVVCVAGGIGITPFLGLLRQHVDSKSEQPLTLIYSVRSTSEAVYHDEIQSLALCSSAVCYRLHVTKAEGRITAEAITRISPNVFAANILLCGPEAMMIGLRDQFMRRGVRQARIHYENFAFIG